MADGRKLGGILTELSLAPDGHVRYAVVGIGINCHQKPEDFSAELENIAISLDTVTGKQTDRANLAAAMVTQLEIMRNSLLTKKNAVMEQYRKDCVTLGRQITVLQGNQSMSATAVGLDDDGGLLVRYGDGRCSTVATGEVSVRGLFGYC